MTVEIRVLGVLEVGEAGETIAVGRAREAALLALLVAHRGQPLPVDRVVEELWEERPPQNAAKTVQVYVSRLRGRLGHERIATTPGGYLLRAQPAEVDAAVAEEHIGEAQRLLAAGETEHAEALLTEALELWRGDPYADFRYASFARAEADRLDELRAAARADRADARLELGWADELIPELEALVASRPLWERPRRQLMLALYRAGRQTEALELYASTRTLLADELGLDPGRELQALERAILNQAPEVQRPPRRPRAGARGPREARAPRSAFVGRGGELRELLDGLAEALAGRGRLCLLTGEPGIGKSRLMDELAAEARADGARVVFGRCREGGGAPAYWPWVQAVRELLAVAPPDLRDSLLDAGAAGLGAMLPELHGVVQPPGSDAARFELFDAVSNLLRQAAGSTPLVVLLDDLHAADEPSLLLLGFLARDLPTMRLLVVAAYRDVDPTLSPRLAALQSELAGERAVSRLRLRGLSADAVAEYVAVAAEEVSSAQLALRLHAETEGNPLFVGETVRLLAIEGVTGKENIGFRIPESVRDVIARRLRHLPRECVEVLETAAILGREFDLAVLAEAVSAPPERLLELLDEAVAARVVAEVDGARGRVRFAHVLIRDTLIDGLSLARRAQLQLAVFAALERLFGDGDAGHAHELAEHALSAGAAPKSLEYARQAVGHARSLHLHDEAARLLRLALEALAIARPTDARGRCALLLELGEAETRAGAAASARSTFVAAADLARVHALDVELALAAAGYGGGVVWGRAGGDPRLVPLLEEGLAAIGDEHLELRVQLLSRLAGALRDEPSRARRAQLSEEAVRLARGSGVPALLSYALGGRGHAIAGPDTLDECLALGAELVELGRRSGSLERVVAAHSLRIVAHTAKGDLASAVRELDVSTALAEEIRHAVSLWDVTSTRVLLDLARGDLDRAEEGRERARAIGERALPEAAPAIDTMQRVALADLRGGLAHVEPGLRAVAEATPERPVFRAALAYTHARLGRREEAMRALDALSGGSFSAVPFDQEWLFAMSFLAEAAVLTGHGCSEELYAALAPWEELAAADVGEGFRGSLARYRGLVAAAAGRNADAHRLFERALAANERMGARPWVAHTLSDQGRLLIEQGEPERGRALLGRALETYEVLGMTAHAEAVSASAF